MWYGVVAPEISGVYSDYRQVKRIKTLYPYCKFRTFATEDEGYAFIRRYRNLHDFTTLSEYGNTFKNINVTMQYIIYKNNVYYNFRTKGINNLRLRYEDALIEYHTNLILVQLPNMKLNKDTIAGNMIAIYHGLMMLGDYLDVIIEIPNHSIFYAINSYSGDSRVLARINEKIRSRLGNIAITISNVKEKGD